MITYLCPDCGYVWTPLVLTASCAWYQDGIERIECPSCKHFNKETDYKNPKHAKVVE